MEEESEQDGKVESVMKDLPAVRLEDYPGLLRLGSLIKADGDFSISDFSLEELQTMHLELEKMIGSLREQRAVLDTNQKEFETFIEQLKKERQRAEMELQQKLEMERLQETERQELEKFQREEEERRKRQEETAKLEPSQPPLSDALSISRTVPATSDHEKSGISMNIESTSIDSQMAPGTEMKHDSPTMSGDSQTQEIETKSVHGAAKGQTNHRTGVQESVSHQKIANQIPITTFWSYVEPYFRKITEEDLKLLEVTQDNDPEPYLIPLLGPHYLDTWNEQEALDSRKNDFVTPKIEESHESDRRRKKFKETNSFEEVSLKNFDYCQPLTERVLASLIDENLPLKDLLGDGEDQGEEDLDMGISISERTPADLMRLEERIRRELCYLGFLDAQENLDYNAKEDDDICGELRYMQKQLQEQVAINDARKKRLLEIVRPYMAHQEFTTFLQEIHISLEQSFVKRYRVQKTKHRKKLTPIGKPLPENISKALQMRRDLIRKYGPFFPKDKFICPDKSIFADLKIDESPVVTGQPFTMTNGSETQNVTESPTSTP
jgi:hypothetical protein